MTTDRTSFQVISEELRFTVGTDPLSCRLRPRIDPYARHLRVRFPPRAIGCTDRAEGSALQSDGQLRLSVHPSSLLRPLHMLGLARRLLQLLDIRSHEDPAFSRKTTSGVEFVSAQVTC